MKKMSKAARAKRDQRIRELVFSDDRIQIDNDAEVSEGDANGAYVQCWLWVGFEDTELDKELR